VRDGAWKFIKYLHSPEQIAEYDKLTGYIPFTKSAAAALADFLDADPRRKVAIEQLEFSRWHMRIHTLSRAAQAMRDAWDEIMQTDVNVRQRLEQLQEECVQITIEEGFTPTLPS